MISSLVTVGNANAANCQIVYGDSLSGTTAEWVGRPVFSIEKKNQLKVRILIVSVSFKFCSP